MTSRILLADDSITIQKVVNRAFAEEGIEVVAVSSGDQAERQLNDVSPDLVLADIFMPGKNGYELCESIKQNPKFRHIPVVLLVGAFEPFDQAEARRVHADDHLTKPFEFRTLIETVRKLISASSQPQTGPLPAMPAVEEEMVRPLEPRPTGPIAAQSFNIDLNAMSEPAAAEAAFAVQTDAAIGVFDESMPLELDYTPSEADSFGAIDLEYALEPSVIQTSDIESPTWKNPTGELSSSADGFTGFEDQAVAEPLSLEDNAVTEGPKPFATFEPRADEPQTFSLDAGASSDDLPVGTGVPSRFSADANNVVLDFEESAMPESSFDGGELAFNPEPESPFEMMSPGDFEQVPEPADIEEIDDFKTRRLDTFAAEDFKASDTNPLEGGAAASTSELADNNFDAPGDFPGAARDDSLFSIDDPLGDLLADESAPPVQAPTIAAQPFPAPSLSTNGFELRFEPEQSEEPVSREIVEQPQFVEQADTAELEMPAAAQAVEVEQLTSEAQPVSQDEFVGTLPDFESLYAETEPASMDEPFESEWAETRYATGELDEARASRFDDDVRSPVETPASFTNSAMWTAEETRFAPIDIEAVPVDEPAARSHEVESPNEKGFSFSAATDLVESEPEPFARQQPEPEATAQAAAQGAELSPAALDEIVRRVVDQMSDTVVREIAWEIVPDAVERVIEKLAREQLARRV